MGNASTLHFGAAGGKAFPQALLYSVIRYISVAAYNQSGNDLPVYCHAFTRHLRQCQQSRICLKGPAERVILYHDLILIMERRLRAQHHIHHSNARANSPGNTDIDDRLGVEFPYDRIGKERCVYLAHAAAHQHDLLFSDVSGVKAAPIQLMLLHLDHLFLYQCYFFIQRTDDPISHAFFLLLWLYGVIIPHSLSFSYGQSQ